MIIDVPAGYSAISEREWRRTYAARLAPTPFVIVAAGILRNGVSAEITFPARTGR